MRPSAELAALLERIDGRGYKSYRDIEGAWSFQDFDLFVDRVQSDPFASPSKLRLRMPLEIAALPDTVLTPGIRRLAAADWLARAFRDAIRSVATPRGGTGKSGLVAIDAGGQEVIERSAVVFREDWVEARIEVGLPAGGRRVRGRDAQRLLIEALPEIARRGWIERDEAVETALVQFVDCIENQEAVRAQLRGRGLVAFVGDGAILPRESGASERPMPREQALPFETPEAFSVTLEVPNPDAGVPGSLWRGMGIPRGVVLLVGGGYHGKSTLLRALERAVVPHVPGDGRETVVADPGLVKIRAEDGRAVTRVDIQTFIDRLPLRPGESRARDTRRFSTSDASGSTSQAANIAEAIEAGASGLLLDEDTAATNFMVRDARMQALIHPDDEPITPFVDRVGALYYDLGLSTVLVMGSSGDYFDVADAVIELKGYRALDVTGRAKAIPRTDGGSGGKGPPARQRDPVRPPRARVPLASGFDARRGRREVKLSSRGCEEILYGTTEIDLRGLEQLFDPSQTRAIAGALYLAARDLVDGERGLAEILDELDRVLDGANEAQGLDALDPDHRPGRHPGALARPRRFEIAGALNRMRTLRIRDDGD